MNSSHTLNYIIDKQYVRSINFFFCSNTRNVNFITLPISLFFFCLDHFKFNQFLTRDHLYSLIDSTFALCLHVSPLKAFWTRIKKKTKKKKRGDNVNEVKWKPWQRIHRIKHARKTQIPFHIRCMKMYDNLRPQTYSQAAYHETWITKKNTCVFLSSFDAFQRWF